MFELSSTSCTIIVAFLLTEDRETAGKNTSIQQDHYIIKSNRKSKRTLGFSRWLAQVWVCFYLTSLQTLPMAAPTGKAKEKRISKNGEVEKSQKLLDKHSYCHRCLFTLFLFLDLPGWNFLSVCLVWISRRSSSPASALSRPFWLFFLVPGGPRPPNTSFGLGPFFFPGGRPEFWEVVRGALESGEPGNWGPVRPMFCWKMSYEERGNVPFSQ